MVAFYGGFKMKKILHSTLIFTFILNITIMLVASIDAYFEIEVLSWLTPDDIMWYLPAYPATMLTAGFSVFILDGKSTLALAIGYGSLLLPAIALIGCFLKNKSVWAYRILVYPILVLSFIAGIAPAFKGGEVLIFIMTAIYLAIAILNDALPE